MTRSGQLCSALVTFALLFLASAAVAQEEEIGCYERGECLESVNVGFGLSDSVQECHKFCQGTTDCNYFTHYSDESLCFMFLDCAEFPGSNCTDCVTAEVTCDNLQCDIPVIDNSIKEARHCNYFSYHGKDSLCFMFLDSTEFTGSNCTNCVLAEVT